MARDTITRQVTGRLENLLRGGAPEPIPAPVDADEDERGLVDAVNRLIGFMAETQAFVLPLSRGELHSVSFSPANYLASPFKELVSRLKHLTWQAEQVTQGDYAQRVDFMGEFSTAFNSMVEALARNERELKDKIAQLEEALSHVRRLEGLLPICVNCKMIRRADADGDSPDDWQPIEQYVEEHTNAEFTHGLCPDCLRELYPDVFGPGGQPGSAR